MNHMHDRFERKFAPNILLAVNLAIIIAAETVGRSAFYETGLIHVIAPLFVLLACVRLFGRFDLYDQPMQSYVGWSVAAFTMFTVIHAIEFGVRISGIGLPEGTTGSLVLFLYLAALLALAAGSFNVLRAAGKERVAVAWLGLSATVSGAALAFALAFRMGVAPQMPPLVSIAIAFLAGVSVVVPTWMVGVYVRPMREFATMLAGSLTFVALAAAMQAVRLVAHGDVAVYAQVTYVGAFAFFAGMSLFFMSFGKLPPAGVSYGPEAVGTVRRAAARKATRPKTS